FSSAPAGADASNDAGRAEADTAAIVIAAALDIAFARREAVGIALAGDDLPLAAFAPAAALFVADHADVLDVAVDANRWIDGERGSGSYGCEEGGWAQRQSRGGLVHFVL